jgi:uncharacterized integral membrane protein
MRARGILLTVLVVLLVAFAAVNWSTLAAPLPVNLLLLRVEVPVGLVLLGVTVGLALVFFAGALFDRAGQLREVRQLEKRLDKARAKLDARRLDEIAELRDGLQAWGASLEKRIDERVGSAEASLREAIAEVEGREKQRMDEIEQRVLTVRNELAADVGEAEDALRRMLDPGRGLPDDTG